MKIRFQTLLKKVIKFSIKYLSREQIYDFNKSNPLGGNGERVDIQFNDNFNFSSLDMYQKSHFKRYEFAKNIITSNEIIGDFACGTGYGSVFVSDIASQVIGADIDTNVIKDIRQRYEHINNVIFQSENLLKLNYVNYFDSIISYETLEHFNETDIFRILNIFRVALKKNGKLFFSTPYMQEESEAAKELGFHLTFGINEKKIKSMLHLTGFKPILFKYQNYDTHNIEDFVDKKDFIICLAEKKC